MNKTIVFISILLLSISNLFAQEWVKDLDQNKLQRGELSLFDYSKAFNDYWEPYKVVDGYYQQNGEKLKAPYWKLFKRWEHYWTDRVDPKTGEFPDTAGADIFEKYMQQNGGNKSSSGNWTNLGMNSSSGGYSGIGRLNCIEFHVLKMTHGGF